MSPFPKIRLGSFLEHRKEFFILDDSLRYKRVRVQLHNKGIVLRDVVVGTELRTKKQQVVQTGDFLVAEIDAKVGGFGIVPPELDGAIVSSHYFLYEIDEAQCFRGWLDAFIRSAGLEDQVKARGTTNYAAIRPEHVFDFEIPLPPIDEQRRVVARIEELAAKIEEARTLRQQAMSECESLCRSIIFDKAIDPPVMTPLREIFRLREPDVVVSGEQSYWFAGVYCFGRGVFRGQRKGGTEFAYTHLTRLRAGDFVYPKLMAWEGALGVVPPECDGLVVSPEFPVFEVDQSRALPETLDVYFRTPSVWPTLSAASTGTNVRRRRLNPGDFLTLQIPFPSMATQQRLRIVMERLGPIKRLQTGTAAELAALLPSILDKAFKGEL